jgi:hypothetical protein
MSIYLRKSHKLSEEDVNDNNNNQVDSSVQSNVSSAEGEKLKQDLAVINAKIAELDRKYNSDKQPYLNQKSAIVNKLASMGISVNSNESANETFRFSKKLFEAVQSGRTDELADSVKETFDSLPDLSYYMDEKGCLTLAKRLLAFLNDKTWNDGENHWDEVVEFLNSTLSKANISLSTREMNQFISKFEEVLRSRTMFSWIFGRNNIEAVEETNELDDSLLYELEPEPIHRPLLYQGSRGSYRRF